MGPSRRWDILRQPRLPYLHRPAFNTRPNPVQPLAGDWTVQHPLHAEADQLRAKKQINRLENIAVRLVEIAEIWQEKGEDFITVKLSANLLDYTTDEKSGEVVSGSRTEPVKFREYWTFKRPVGDHPWRLFVIHQAE